MLSSGRNKGYSCEIQAKFIQGRIDSVERSFAELCTAFAQYSLRAAKIRDKGDELASIVTTHANLEDINVSLREALMSFAGQITKISDYGNLRVLNIDKNVVNELSQYELICKHCKEDVKEIFATRDKETMRKKQLDRLRERNPNNRQQIIQAESELAKATSEMSHTLHYLEEKIISFEQKKIIDIKSIFLDFITYEIAYHAKCLELLTKAYQDVKNIKEEEDVEEFRKIVQDPGKIIATRTKLFKKSQSMNALNLFTKPKRTKSPEIPITREPKLSRRISRSSNDMSVLHKTEEQDDSSSVSDDENSLSNSDTSSDDDHK